MLLPPNSLNFLDGRMNKLILVDSMNLCYRIAHVPAFSGLRSSTGVSTGILHSFLTSILSYVDSSDRIEVAWDNRSHKKREIYLGYKAGRDELDEITKSIRREVSQQLPTLRRLLSLMGITQYDIPGYEADEIIATLACGSGDVDVTILSEDKDFLQLVSKRISIWQPIKQRLVSDYNFSKHYLGLNPKEYLVFRMLTGDESDEISGIPGCGEKTALEIIQSNMIFSEFKVDIPKKYKLIQKLDKKISWDEAEEIVNRNRELMKLSYDSIPHGEFISYVIHPTENPDRLYNIIDRLELKRVKELLIGRRELTKRIKE
jgi:DNA polymerase I